MSDINVLKEYYVRYLRDVRGVKLSTVNHYLGAINVVSKYLSDSGKIKKTIYEIDELAELECIREFLFAQPDFVEKDERGNRMYSAGINNYIRFATGEDFGNIGNSVALMDIEVPISSKQTVTIENWRRNGIIKKQSIELASFLCEIDSAHKTFISASTNEQYMEGHHAIPFKEQAHFKVSLDVYANIVCLCPICHRMLHYGIKNDKETVLNKLYSDRAERLAHSGIYLSKDEFIEKAI
ncbi:MAG: HNH endonuclease [Lachnospiraceae bacterium]|nr:HNH endonuclease [Lachnospiraceae bacterium]